MINKRLPKFLKLYKPQGVTPVELINQYKKDNKKFQNVPMAFAGRLDPLATGKMLILVGEECKKREFYNNLDKEYEFEVLLKFSSDTGDVMGLSEHDNSKSGLEQMLDEKPWQTLLGKQEFPYPIFSSKPVDGKPLFAWALEGNTGHLDIPTKEVEIYKLNLVSKSIISAKELNQSINSKIDSIPVITDPKKSWGKDFRRPEIREQWEAVFSDIGDEEKFVILKFCCLASSGTYMRTLAGEIGGLLGTRGLAYSIHRTKIGKYNKQFRLWTRKY